MCGICGQYNFGNGRPVLREDLERMTATMVHRGPDDKGIYLSGPLGFGFRRLSIIDIEGGHQPMSDREGSVWVVLNGEIYNFPELRRELSGYGHEFTSRSDTEVIIHGYKQWGLEVFDHLNGMFGIAIWDEKNRRLILVRDPMGIKVVYFQIGKDQVLFGSEIRAILANLKEKPAVDPLAVDLFLRYRYTPSPFTLFKGIKKLAPGTMLVADGSGTSVKRWYNFKPGPFSPLPSPESAKAELLEIYRRSVKRHLLSDVPVGLLLSGGVDSGLLLGLMNEFGDSWPTYTVGYGETFRDDELKDAERTARIFSSRHVPVQINQGTFEEALSNIVSFLEEPVATSSIVPMYFVCKRAREDIKVALVGQGPDELFGGYPRHFGIHYGAFWRKIPGPVRAFLKASLGSLPRNEAVKRGLYSLDLPDRFKRYQEVFSIAPGSTIDGLFQPGILPEKTGDLVLNSWEDLFPLMEETDELGGFQFLEVRSSLPDELLMYTDKMSMAHSLEVRVPYLDREVVEYAQRLPEAYKINLFGQKRLHRMVCRDFLPGEILKRKKRGFATNVVDSWFNGSMKGEFEAVLLNARSPVYDYLEIEMVKNLLDEHRSGKNDNHKILFSIVMFGQWLKLFTNS